jgi:hypothetical protein
MAPPAPVILLPPTLASTEVLGPPLTREHLLVPEVHGLADGIVDASRTSLCMCPGCCAGKEGQQPVPQSSRERPQLAESQRSLQVLVLGTLTLNRDSPC